MFSYCIIDTKNFILAVQDIDELKLVNTYCTNSNCEISGIIRNWQLASAWPKVPLLVRHFVRSVVSPQEIFKCCYH